MACRRSPWPCRRCPDRLCPDPARKLSCMCRLLPWTYLWMCKKCKRCPGSTSASEEGVNDNNMVKVADHVQHHGDGDTLEHPEKARHGLGDGDCG